MHCLCSCCCFIICFNISLCWFCDSTICFCSCLFKWWWCTCKSIYWCQTNMISTGRITRASGKLSDHNLWGNKPPKEKRCLRLLFEVVQDAEVSYYCPESHKELWYNEKKVTTEDDQNESPATMTACSHWCWLCSLWEGWYSKRYYYCYFQMISD